MLKLYLKFVLNCTWNVCVETVLEMCVLKLYLKCVCWNCMLKSVCWNCTWNLKKSKQKSKQNKHIKTKSRWQNLSDSLENAVFINELSLSDCGIGCYSQQCMGDVQKILENLSVLKKLDLSFNSIGLEGFEILAEVIPKIKLEVLDLSGFFFLLNMFFLLLCFFLTWNVCWNCTWNVCVETVLEMCVLKLYSKCVCVCVW